ncbi:Hydroxyproline-rich glycoprotein [Pleurostoma richardsiae]|uniref:Hydroxyproline-rich glycoprotein n=1 Tax=Pleurostoma richardsiae TaxID=41990 RepID=A0AA38VL65_9PEZI|nr:Hydroxyproline-rich glycoprotein [Pleurostoma richardsiae]
MEEAAGAQDGDPADSSRDTLPRVVDIAPKGDAVLDVTFETSKETLISTRRSTQIRRGQTLRPSRPLLRATIRLAYRVDVGVLKKQSSYFANLLGDTRFEEARSVAKAFKELSLRNLKPADLEPKDLPWVSIIDDDEATRAANREVVFADLLRILHGRDVVTKPPSMLYVTTLAVLADRFICTAPVSRYLTTGLKFKWPVTPKTLREDSASLTVAAEEVLRQKILVAWLLDQPPRLHTATRELILYGSHQWTAYPEDDASSKATWWDLQDDLERELQYRRECILNTVASVLHHFLSLYTSRTRQCKLGYDSSVACDSYQLGEMVKFLSNKELLFFVDFSPCSLESVKDYSTVEIGHILSVLKQCPSYQIDKNHTNCGLRTRILPILEYIQAMLSSNSISIARSAWKNNRAETSWIPVEDGDYRDAKEKVFRFTRSLSGDQRLRYEGAMAADRMARQLFTASSWDWTPED